VFDEDFDPQVFEEFELKNQLLQPMDYNKSLLDIEKIKKIHGDINLVLSKHGIK
jgi:hypothetical protein